MFALILLVVLIGMLSDPNELSKYHHIVQEFGLDEIGGFI